MRCGYRSLQADSSLRCCGFFNLQASPCRMGRGQQTCLEARLRLAARSGSGLREKADVRCCLMAAQDQSYWVFLYPALHCFCCVATRWCSASTKSSIFLTCGWPARALQAIAPEGASQSRTGAASAPQYWRISHISQARPPHHGDSFVWQPPSQQQPFDF